MTDNNSLFSDEVLDELEGGLFSSQNKQTQVTVLGKTFANDDERRAYFREELRKKLPKLKQIEGYPIGEDDDIINLSDPPYFTACPNPWMKDFIMEWENSVNYKPSKNVSGPFANDVSVGKNNPIYNAHSYHTKVPHPAIMRYLLHYTNPGDIVFDGFAGTGMVGVAASMCGHCDPILKHEIEDEFFKVNEKPEWGKRNSICGDLSPYASFIAYNYNTPVIPSIFEREASKILNDVKKEYGWMYETKHFDGRKGIISFVVWSDVFVCPNCGHEIIYYNEGVDNESKSIREEFPCPSCGTILTKKSMDRCRVSSFDKHIGKSIMQTKTVPVLIKYTTEDGKRYEKYPDKEDLALIDKISNMECPYWFPTDKMMGKDGRWGEQWRSFHEGYEYVHNWFTSRNLFIAAAIYKKTIGKGVLNVMMTSYLVNIGSKMARYKMGKSGNVNMPGTLYIASATAEQNLFQGYRGKIKDFSRIYSTDSLGVVNVASASQSSLPDNSVDYIFTDPPFGDNIMYSELNYIQECWLKVKTQNKEEAIVSSFYNKGIPEYQSLMLKSFKEYYRILKPNHWITIEFSSTRASVWNAIQNALQASGFIVANVASIDKQQASYNAVTSTTAVKQDIIITCYKPDDTIRFSIEKNTTAADSIWEFITDYLSHVCVHHEKEGATTTIIERNPRILYDKLISYYVAHGYPVPIDSTAFQIGLAERFLERDGMYFTAEQLIKYEEKKKLTSEFIPMGLIVSNEADGIEWLRNKLRSDSLTYQEIYPDWMHAVNGVRKNDIIPELKQILDENFIQESDGRWRIPNIQDDKDVSALRSKTLLKEFKVYVEQASKPKSKIKEVRVEAVRAGFKQCYIDKDFNTIVMVGNKIPQNLLEEDEAILQFYDIAVNHV